MLTKQQKRKQQTLAAGLLMAASVHLFAESGSLEFDENRNSSRLLPCPASPNCVSSLVVEDSSHTVEPFVLSGSSENAWGLLRAAVLSLPRTKIVAEEPGYLHAETRSALFGFVDHLEFEVDTTKGIINVRSASVTGYGDFGVNRRRVEKLRQILAEKGGD